jgi:hypothetical protein
MSWPAARVSLDNTVLSQCKFWGFHWEHLAYTTLSHDEMSVEVG